MEPGAERMLSYKRLQRVPLRSTLNFALFDMRKLEYDIRRTVVSSDRLMSANVLKDHYVEELMLAKRTEVFAELVPRKYRRAVSPSPHCLTPDLPGRSTHTPVPPRLFGSKTPLRKPSTRKDSEGLDTGLRRSADIISLQLKCRHAKNSVKVEKRSVDYTIKRVLKEYGRCSEDVQRALTGRDVSPPPGKPLTARERARHRHTPPPVTPTV